MACLWIEVGVSGTPIHRPMADTKIGKAGRGIGADRRYDGRFWP